MLDANLTSLAARYTEAWCSQDPARVADCYAENGSLSVNDAPPANGRTAIAEIARGFMRDFPDMIVRMDKISQERDGAFFHWTLIGRNTGPGGTGNEVRISGYERWQLTADGLISESQGHFDAAEYDRQLNKPSHK